MNEKYWIIKIYFWQPCYFDFFDCDKRVKIVNTLPDFVTDFRLMFFFLKKESWVKAPKDLWMTGWWALKQMTFLPSISRFELRWTRQSSFIRLFYWFMNFTTPGKHQKGPTGLRRPVLCIFELKVFGKPSSKSLLT